MSGIDTYTKLLLHCDGADASTTFTDSATGKTVTVYGNAQIDTAQSKFGGASGLFDGTGDYLTTPDSSDFAFGTGDFTIDFWYRFNAVPGTNTTQRIYSQYNGGDNWVFLSFQDISGSFYFRLESAPSAYTANIDVNKTTTVSTNTWYHFAVVRNGNNFMMFKDGTQIGTTVVDADSMFDSSQLLNIGSQNGSSNFLNGWIDEFRVSKGIARWTTNFTPPVSPYSKVSGGILKWFF